MGKFVIIALMLVISACGPTVDIGRVESKKYIPEHRDKKPARVGNATVLRKVTVPDKYFVVLSGEEICVSKEIYEAVNVGDSVTITDGALKINNRNP